MPAATNVDCQPNLNASHGITAGAINAPALVPALKMLVANARSRFGNHNATDFIADGKFPDSPSPSAARAVINPPTLPTRACPAAATLHAAMETAYPIFVPK